MISAAPLEELRTIARKLRRNTITPAQAANELEAIVKKGAAELRAERLRSLGVGAVASTHALSMLGPIEGFAARVNDAATKATPATGRWANGGKVFINHLWRAVGVGTLTLDQFKARLLQAHKQGLIDMSRADLVQAMPREDVAESEIVDKPFEWSSGASWNFVRDPKWKW